jgi:hypothetical protein
MGRSHELPVMCKGLDYWGNWQHTIVHKHYYRLGHQLGKPTEQLFILISPN